MRSGVVSWMSGIRSVYKYFVLRNISALGKPLNKPLWRGYIIVAPRLIVSVYSTSLFEMSDGAHRPMRLAVQETPWMSVEVSQWCVCICKILILKQEFQYRIVVSISAIRQEVNFF
jgi:hypothetical protein